MKLPLFSLGILVTLALIATGCGNGTTTETPAPPNDTSAPASASRTPVAPPDVMVQESGSTSHGSQKVVVDFLGELMRGNTQKVVALLTPLAQQQYANGTSFLFQPEIFEQVEFRITGSDLMDENDPNYFSVYANMIMNQNVDEPVLTVWAVRKIGDDDYRVAGMMFYDDETQKMAEFNFEVPKSPAGVAPDAPAQQQATNQMPLNNQPPVMQQNNQPMLQQNPQQMAQPFVPTMQ